MNFIILDLKIKQTQLVRTDYNIIDNYDEVKCNIFKNNIINEPY
jgi:hypothetical protein